ncbi:MAG TPA: hypothetical protein VGQ90_00790 [Stellaceae bacterium]|jgi:hypothetical protein|nr:hypothetical protein [Stellaceae bacterium]
MLIVSIVIELAVAIIAALAAARRGRPSLYGLALTFALYVAYDGARLLQVDVQQGLLSALFLIASVSALVAVWDLYRR